METYFESVYFIDAEIHVQCKINLKCKAYKMYQDVTVLQESNKMKEQVINVLLERWD